MVEILAFLALLGAFYPLLFLSRLGEGAVFPIHYNILGKVDDWGSKGFLWFLPLIAVVIYVGLSILGRYSWKLNYLHKVTASNKDSTYKLGSSLLRYLKLFILFIFAYINNTSYLIAIEKESKLNGVVMIILLSGFWGALLFFIIKMKKLTKSAKQPSC